MPSFTPVKFKAQVTAIVEVHGVSTFTATGDIDDHINRALRDFTRRSKCLYSESAAFTLTANLGGYALNGSAFSQDFFTLDSVIVNGQQLLNFQGKPSHTPWSELEDRHPNWRLEPDAMPQRWLMRGPQNLVLWPAPDQVYGNSRVSGWYLHPDIADWTSTDATLMLIPEVWQMAAAVYAAAWMLTGGRATASDFEMVDRLSQDAGAQIRELFNVTRDYEGAPFARGESQASHFID